MVATRNGMRRRDEETRKYRGCVGLYIVQKSAGVRARVVDTMPSVS